MYNTEKRERVEAWPVKGTKEALEILAKKKKMRLAAFIVDLLEKKAGTKVKPTTK